MYSTQILHNKCTNNKFTPYFDRSLLQHIDIFTLNDEEKPKTGLFVWPRPRGESDCRQETCRTGRIPSPSLPPPLQGYKIRSNERLPYQDGD